MLSPIDDPKVSMPFALPEKRLVSLHQFVLKGEAAASAMHQLYNVLSSSLSNLDTTLREPKSDLQQEKLHLIKDTLQDGLNLVSHLRRFFKRELTPEKQEVDIHKVIDDALAFAQLLCKPKPQFIRTQIHIVRDRRKLPRVLGNPSQLTQAFAAIIINAIEALPNGGLVIIRTKTDRRWITVTFTDNGIGITNDQASKIFTPFFTTKEPEAPGLGLTVARALINHHSGQIEIESHQGIGTTITVKLPGMECLKTASVSAPSEVIPVNPPSQSKRILLIDDELYIVELLSRILEKGNHSVTSAYDGHEGIHYFRPGTFDVVFIDLILPNMSGLEVARRIRSIDPRVKIILLTAWGEGLDENLLRENGVDLVAPKPFTINTILNLVSRNPVKR